MQRELDPLPEEAALDELERTAVLCRANGVEIIPGLLDMVEREIARHRDRHAYAQLSIQ